MSTQQPLKATFQNSVLQAVGQIVFNLFCTQKSACWAPVTGRQTLFASHLPQRVGPTDNGAGKNVKMGHILLLHLRVTVEARQRRGLVCLLPVFRCHQVKGIPTPVVSDMPNTPVLLEY